MKDAWICCKYFNMILKLEGKNPISISVPIDLSLFLSMCSCSFFTYINYDKEGSTTFDLKPVFVRILGKENLDCNLLNIINFLTVLVRH